MERSSDANDLNLKYASRGVWLVKVPKYMSECWMNANPGDEVGKVVISTTRFPNDATAKAAIDVEFHTNEQLAASQTISIPTVHKFIMKKEGRKELPLTHAILSTEDTGDSSAGSSQGTSSQQTIFTEQKTAIEGRVIDRAECKPTGDSSYMLLKRQRLEASTKPQKEIRQLDKPVNNYKPISIHESQLEYEQKKKDEGKKTRLEKEQVQELLFAAFEKHQYYNVKDLVRITNQPITFLKEVLKELCVYNMKAPHKNMWELKAEYRHYKAPDAGKDVSS